jgi:Ca2+-binding RTX toxin-like protein
MKLVNFLLCQKINSKLYGDNDLYMNFFWLLFLFTLSTTFFSISDSSIISTWADIINGTDGNDSLKGTDKVDKMFSGLGNDTLYGDNGNDILYGHEGNDTLKGDSGADLFYCGNGNDRIMDFTTQDRKEADCEQF